jgi:lipid II:glycine glycyltransferase (peptidoglycan interpeptide bridge formation enzyme)
MKDIRQAPAYAKYLRNIGWTTRNINHTYYFIKKIPLLGSVVKLQRPEEIKIKDVLRLAEKHKAFSVIIEPKTELTAKYLVEVGFRPSKSPYLPTKTLQLDLTKTKKDLSNQLKKDARYSIRKAKELRARNCELGDIKKFRNAWKKAVSFKRYVPPVSQLKALKKSFGNNALFLKTETDSAGAIFLLADKIGYYWQAFSGQEGRRQLAQYELVWEGILWAKKQGAKVFDFEGIYDERFPNKRWKGFTHFKKSFGGHEVEYPGAFVKSLLPKLR